MNWGFVDALRVRLADRSSVIPAIERFAPSHTRALRFQPPPLGARQASVIALLYPRNDQWHLPLLVRTNHLKYHGGQVALPGGAHEPHETLWDTALRELHEELGIPPTSVQLLGSLTPFFVPVSAFQVHPWVGFTSGTPAFQPSPAEVEQLLETPAAPILNLSTLRNERREIRGQSSEVPYFSIGPHKVWGATCIVLGELATLCSELEP
jgi:8-oxo-dGTP pyrophosphatase MutT (NUDIX family)